MINETFSTDEVAALFRVLPQSIRHAVTVKGHYFGLRPIKRPNRFLAWPRDEVERVLRGENSAGKAHE